jgi:HEAT repeat protein
MVPRLVPLLDDPDPQVRAAVGQALKKIEAGAKGQGFFGSIPEGAAATSPGREPRGQEREPWGPTPSPQPPAGQGDDASAKEVRRIQELEETLRHKNPSFRIIAARSLGAAGAAAKPVLPLLVKALDDRDGNVRIEVAGALLQLGHEADRAAALLLAALKDRDRAVRDRAVQALRYSPKPPATAAVPRLRQALADEDAAVRGAAAWALAGIGPGAKDAMPDLRKALDDANGQARVGAAYALCRAGDAKAGLSVLIAALQERDAPALHDACLALAQLGAPAQPAVPALLALVKAKTEPACGDACYALHGIGPAARAALPALLAELRGLPARPPNPPSPGLSHPMHALVGIGKDAIAPLIALLRDQDFDVRGRARATLALIGQDAVPALAAAWKGDDKLLRENAWWALFEVGGPAATAVFLDALNDPGYRLEAAHGLMHMRSVPATALPALLKLLDDPDPEMRARVARAVGMVDGVSGLGRLHAPASAARRRAALALEPLLNDKSGHVREEALIGLRCLGLDAVPVWSRAMKHPDVEVRRLATQGFNPRDAIGLRSAEVVPALLAAVDDPDERVSANARGALTDLGRPAPEVVQGLLQVLLDQKAAHRVRAAEYLGAAGAAAGHLVPRLRPLLNDPDPNVRAAVGQALKKIDPGAGVK